MPLLYKTGEGTEKNLEKTFYWHQKVTENGKIDAQFNFGNYDRGAEKTFHWHQKATANAMNSIGCKNGEGTGKKFRKGFLLVTKSNRKLYCICDV